MAQENTFNHAILEFPNASIHGMLAKVINFRIQLIKRQEFKSLSGWNDAMNHYLQKELETIHDILQVNTVKQSGDTQEELESRVADSTRTLAETYDDTTFAQDEILGSTRPPKPIVWDLSGSDPNIPQPTVENVPNDVARSFITELDYMFVELTRLDSRHNSIGIEKYDALKIESQFLEPLWSITMRFGGEENRSDIPDGVLPSDEQNTFQG